MNKREQIASNAQFNNNGFSLIEILVAVGLSSVIMLAVTSLLSNNLALVDSTNASSQSLERGNYASYILTRYIRQAGFVNFFDAGVDPTKVTQIERLQANCGANTAASCNGAGTSSDRLAVIFDVPTVNVQSMANYTTCDGTVVPTLGVTVPTIKEVFYIATSAITGANGQRNSLFCDSYVLTSPGNYDRGVIQGTELVPGINNMQILYGLAANEDELSVDRYISIDSTAIDFIPRLRAIKIALLVETDSGASAPGNNQFNLLGTQINIPNGGGNGYRVYNNVISLNHKGAQF